MTATATDTQGLTTTETRTIVVSDRPPAEDEQPPKIALAPVLEAKLEGRTITLNARVTLRNGKQCKGKATATTVFGTTTSRTTLKLATVDGKCIGTGTIKLKKAPSTRTKLRITVSSKSVKTRTLSTKRG